MIRIALMSAIAAFAAAATSSFAGAPPTEAPTMQFRVLPANEKIPSTEHAVTPYRINDLLHVVVKDPVRCGQKPINPSFELKPGKLILRYELTPAAAGAAACTVVSEFNIHNAPHEDLSVSFSGGGEPLSAATLKKCSFYDPKTNDVWECLTPAAPMSK